MRYAHPLRVIRHKKSSGLISLTITGLLVLLITFLVMIKLDAKQFLVGFTDSLFRVTISYFISLFLGLIITLIVTSHEKVEALTIPILDVLQSFPSFALFPLLIVWFGRTTLVTIIILVVAMIWPILFTLFSARKAFREDLLEVAKIFGAKGYKSLLYVILPLLWPAIITGSIVAWGEAWEAIIAAEIIVGITGVGTYLGYLGQAGQTQTLIFGILTLLAILFILNKYIWLPLLDSSTRYQQET